MSNPFESTFESLGSIRGVVAPEIHQAEFERLTQLLDEPEGKLISLRAPRAGYGKTMLLSRVQAMEKNKHLFIPVHLAEGTQIDPAAILEDLLSLLSEDLPAGGGLTRLDLHIRRIFSLALAPLVYSGEIPCQDREAAFLSLRDRPVESFDFQNEGSAIAQWCKAQFELLSPRLANEVSRQSGAGGRDAKYWIDVFYRFATQPLGDPQRVAEIMETVFGSGSRFRSRASFQEGLTSLLGIIGLCESVILVLDEVEGLSDNSDAALRSAAFVCGLWESAPKTSVILSINDDVWDSAFAPRLPLGLKDRFDDEVIRLEILTPDEAKNLLESRAKNQFGEIWRRLDLKEDELYPRNILKGARRIWNELAKEEERNREVASAPGPQPSTQSTPAPAESFASPAVNPFATPAEARQQEARPFARPVERPVIPPNESPESSSFGGSSAPDPARPFAARENKSFPPAQAGPATSPGYPPFKTEGGSNREEGSATGSAPSAGSPFSVAKSASPAPGPYQPPAEAQTSSASQAESSETPQKPAFSPFAENNNPASPATPPTSATSTPQEGDGDSVEELLRQFRERNVD